MRTYKFAIVAAAACAMVGTPAAVYADDEQEARVAAAADRQTHPEVRKVIEDLQAARYELSRADRKFFTERGDAREQVNYALTQLFAFVGDKQWEEQDKAMWERQKREGEQSWERREGRVEARPASTERPYFRMHNALERLDAARYRLDDVSGDLDGRKGKTLTFIDEAQKAIRIGMDKARQEARAELREDRDHVAQPAAGELHEDRAQPAAAQQHPELRKAIEDLQAARHHIANADRRFFTERGDAIKQVQFALEQLFTAVGDKQWQEQDKQLWEREHRESEAKWQQRRETVLQNPTTPDQPFTRMQSAVDRLQAARDRIDDIGPGYGGRKAKAVEFITEAEKAVKQGMEKAREDARRREADRNR